MSNLYTELETTQQQNHRYYHPPTPSGMVAPDYLYQVNENLMHRNQRDSDTHPVDHGLDKESERILHKILARDYPTETGVGRKRGAILRYIKHFKDTQHTPPKVNGKTLYKYLKRNG